MRLHATPCDSMRFHATPRSHLTPRFLAKDMRSHLTCECISIRVGCPGRLQGSQRLFGSKMCSPSRRGAKFPVAVKCKRSFEGDQNEPQEGLRARLGKLKIVLWPWWRAFSNASRRPVAPSFRCASGATFLQHSVRVSRPQEAPKRASKGTS